MKSPKLVRRKKSATHSRLLQADRNRLVENHNSVQVETVMAVAKQNDWMWKSSEKFLRDILPYYLWACSKEWVQCILPLCVALFLYYSLLCAFPCGQCKGPHGIWVLVHRSQCTGLKKTWKEKMIGRKKKSNTAMINTKGICNIRDPNMMQNTPPWK